MTLLETLESLLATARQLPLDTTRPPGQYKHPELVCVLNTEHGLVRLAFSPRIKPSRIASGTFSQAIERLGKWLVEGDRECKYMGRWKENGRNYLFTFKWLEGNHA